MPSDQKAIINRKIYKEIKIKYALSAQQHTISEAQENIKIIVTEDVESVIKSLKDYFIINHPKLSAKKLHKLLSQHFKNIQNNYEKSANRHAALIAAATMGKIL